jgi:ribose-phosphate pyrophosphokinase
MITLNGKTVEIGSFPDGTILMKQSDFGGLGVHIEWKYEDERELVALIYLVKHLHSKGYHRISLYMPYIPNARQDRVKKQDDVFTLKYFSEIINDLDFFAVRALDPHSDVSAALINNLWIDSPKKYIEEALFRMKTNESVDTDHILVFYPDNGSARRYADVVNRYYAYGVKKRDWETGKIIGLDIVDNGFDIKDKDILIVDDICSRGGTFYHSAKKLKELGAKDIYLYVSHCENTILEGDLLKGDLIKKVYTTDSIFTKSHEKIEVLK